jgi:hypothetical protein
MTTLYSLPTAGGQVIERWIGKLRALDEFEKTRECTVHPDDPTGLSDSLAQPLAGRREADPEKARRVRLLNSLLHGEDQRQIESDLYMESRLVF